MLGTAGLLLQWGTTMDKACKMYAASDFGWQKHAGALGQSHAAKKMGGRKCWTSRLPHAPRRKLCVPAQHHCPGLCNPVALTHSADECCYGTPNAGSTPNAEVVRVCASRTAMSASAQGLSLHGATRIAGRHPSEGRSSLKSHACRFWGKSGRKARAGYAKAAG